MPNPLTLATSTPTTPNKPGAGQRENHDSKGSTSFLDVMKEKDIPSEPEAMIADAQDTEAEVEARTPDVEGTPPLPPKLLVENQVSQPTRVAENITTAQPVNDSASEVAPTQNETSMVTNPEANLVDEVQRPVLRRDNQPMPAPPSATPVLSEGKNAGNPASATRGSEIIRSDGPATAQTAHSVGPVSKLVVNPSAMGSRLADDPQSPPIPAGTSARTNAPKPAPTVAQIQLIAAAKAADLDEVQQSEKAEGLLSSRDEPSLHTTRESGAQLISTSATTRAEIARVIAGQLAAAIQSRPGSGAIKIALNPEELGRVSIVLNGREDGLHVTIAAERPETLDLMRRHMATLTAEFQKLGYGEMSFDLGTSPDQHHENAGSQAGSLFEPTADESEIRTDPVPRRTAPGSGIDMRL
ncbi:flagellar hook-length control protein FliK [uncultured Ruegeria sp.]|uniref:flagellar hook-length control protein FliK n=1 Tax=uncultured Ruegeria sp. TaxID=259304 RepID=UPI00261E3A14|nr:flagellar hook-length control protein FliK [uncultured Ruegeria sp.]